jgi:hypothetical protein
MVDSRISFLWRGFLWKIVGRWQGYDSIQDILADLYGLGSSYESGCPVRLSVKGVG